jgi:hypothetical protein
MLVPCRKPIRGPVSVSIQRSTFPSLTNTSLKFAGGKPGALNVAMAAHLEVINTTGLSPGKSRNRKSGFWYGPPSRRTLQDRIYFEQHRAFHDARGAVQVSLLVPQTH